MKSRELIVPILLFIGTSGLLLNEFLFSWGRLATLAFAGISTLGFAILGFAYLRNKNAKEANNHNR